MQHAARRTAPTSTTPFPPPDTPPVVQAAAATLVAEPHAIVSLPAAIVQSTAIDLANQAIVCLEWISTDDPEREQSLQMVEQWIRNNR